jgi:adenylate cyclase
MAADEQRGAEPAVGDSLWRSEIFRRVLAGERLRNSRQIAAFRCVALALLLALTLVFRALAPGFVTAAIGLTTLYLVGAVAILAVRRRSSRGARFDALLVPVLDMPMMALIAQEVIRTLHGAGYSRDAANLATFTPVYFALSIVLTALSLDVAQIVVAAAVGIVLQTLLLRWAHPENTFMLVQGGLILLFAAAIGLYARARTVGLARAYAERQRAVERLGRYFSPQVAERLAQQADEMGSGESREVTVLFADLRDFTALSETLAGPAVVAILNEFLAAMVDEVFACGGTLDKYMGDGLIRTWYSRRQRRCR